MQGHRAERVRTLLTEQLSAEGRLTGQLCMAGQDRQAQPCKRVPVLQN